MSRYITESEYLHEVIQSYGKNMDTRLVDFYRDRSKAVKNLLTEKYRSELTALPKYSGSVSKATEIITEFDIDIIVPFRKVAFKDAQTMLRRVNRYLKNEAFHELQNATEFRPQRVSGGIEFQNFWGSKEIWIDIVPGIETSTGMYNKVGSLHLWDRKDNKTILTNIQKQKDFVRKSHKNANKVIRLMKILRYNQEDFPKIKSFLLGILVAHAFRANKGKVPAGLWPQLRMVLEFLSVNIMNIRLIDPGNPRNELSHLISENKRNQLRRICSRILRQTSSDINVLETYFPRN